MQLVWQLLVLDPGHPLDVRRAAGEQRVELAAADDPEPQLGRESCRLEDRLEAVQRDQLADEERGERLFRLPARPKHALLCPDEADLEPVARQPGQIGEELGVRVRVRDDEVGAPQRPPVDRAKRPRGKRAAPKPAAVLDQRVRERDERVEDDGSPARRAPRREQVEVARIADDDGVGSRPATREQPQLGEQRAARRRQARATTSPPVPPRPARAARSPRHRRRAAPRSPARCAGSGARRCRSRGHARGATARRARAARARGSRRRAGRPRAPVRSSWWLVISSESRPSEKNWKPTTTSSTPSVSSGRWPIAAPVSLRIVR